MENANAVLIAISFLLVQFESTSVGYEESTDIYIRRLAGISAPPAKNGISIVDVGHMPLDPMISIVANHVAGQWHVSYACAASPRCASGSDHMYAEYDLSNQLGQRVDTIIDNLRNGIEPGGTLPGSTTINCGRLTVKVNYRGFRRTYYRACDWGKDFGELETLLRQPTG